MDSDNNPSRSRTPPPDQLHADQPRIDNDPSNVPGQAPTEPAGPVHASANADATRPRYDPSVHRIALVRFYGHTSATSATTTVDVSLIHKFDWSRPLGDYLVPRQDTKGLITYEPAQVLKLAATRGELEYEKNAPINPDKRIVFSKKRYTNLFDHLLARDGPIGGEDNEQSLTSSNSEDEEKENKKKSRSKKVQKANKRNAKKIQKKKVPQPKQIEQEDLEILEFQAREMPGLNFNIEDEGELQDLKIRLVRTESERAGLEAKLAQVIREKRI
ncbi:hypothetical protein QAD02_002277 [Eretmocerus hayati]|uniref:Uncharacterized protein n=1 Tax=Eretmocerus hayati TaxID=131215 RepID=A0ACC2NIK8_9HYME|nr:hypothetical protein QAD02_002277 [Eretmocerus hayati]